MEASNSSINEAYWPLPYLYSSFTSVWLVFASCWIINTYINRHFQVNSLQWTLASVPCVKALQLAFSFFFWYSCFYYQTCSLWMSFGVYVTGLLFETASIVSFLLISHGYCITSERLSVPERRAMAVLGCVFYLILNLSLLSEQLNFIEDEDVQEMHDAVYTKYLMFKKFRGAMHIVAIAETTIFINMDSSVENYWMKLLAREWAHFCIFLYIGYGNTAFEWITSVFYMLMSSLRFLGMLIVCHRDRWIFRSQDLAPRFSVMPTHKSRSNRIVPPIYSIELDEASFKDFSSREWQIGVPTSSQDRISKDSILVVIQHPHASRPILINSGSGFPTNSATISSPKASI
ncbi:Transmembrane receptor, eukaryota [Cynara cardunculus var. scolymus]|uniref:Transmembrane receptor, eukaryota n=1 Tax=Cynara cardunculus var. scolymus TaxID=59895 RepID=A0A103YBD4_CYNCS|nr:Transmembrane receptor, eukaryota [Cynara cardunculus var. scolymus]